MGSHTESVHLVSHLEQSAPERPGLVGLPGACRGVGHHEAVAFGREVPLQLSHLIRVLALGRRKRRLGRRGGGRRRGEGVAPPTCGCCSRSRTRF